MTDPYIVAALFLFHLPRPPSQDAHAHNDCQMQHVTKHKLSQRTSCLVLSLLSATSHLPQAVQVMLGSAPRMQGVV